MALQVTVAPEGDSWRVSAPGSGDQAYSSGARAEEAGRRLAHRLAVEGLDAELVVVVRGGWIAARILHAARIAA